MSNNPEEHGFNAQIFECINRALYDLGRGVKESFYHQIKQRHTMFHPMEFASKPEVLIAYLRELVGESGSSVIEKLIMREIKSSFGIDIKDRATKLSGGMRDPILFFTALLETFSHKDLMTWDSLNSICLNSTC